MLLNDRIGPYIVGHDLITRPADCWAIRAIRQRFRLLQVWASVNHTGTDGHWVSSAHKADEGWCLTRSGATINRLCESTVGHGVSVGLSHLGWRHACLLGRIFHTAFYAQCHPNKCTPVAPAQHKQWLIYGFQKRSMSNLERYSGN